MGRAVISSSTVVTTRLGKCVRGGYENSALRYRSVFFGTPPFAVPALKALAEVTSVAAVVSQPDRPSGRGMKLKPSAVKLTALELGLPVHQPEKVRTGALQKWLEELEVDVALVVAYGRILPLGVLNAPRLGCVNLHASHLPRWRGAAPIQWAILKGDTSTGISLMQMDVGMDTGPVFLSQKMAINSAQTGGELTEALSHLAASMVVKHLPSLLDGKLLARPQDNSHCTEAPPVRACHFLIDWHKSAVEIANQVRAFAPAPGAVTYLNGARLKILQAQPMPDKNAPVGLLSLNDSRVEIGCGQGSLSILVAQAAGRKAQPIRDLLNGRVLREGQQLTSEPAQ